MLSLDEIIKHVEYVVCHNNDEALVCMGIKEYRQLAELLRELQERRKAPEIVRCGECEHFRKEHDGEMWCGVSRGHGIDKDFFCGDAERRTDGQNQS